MTIRSRTAFAVLLATLLCLSTLAPARADPVGVPVPEGYRQEHYRAPTPDRVPGGRRIDVAEAATLHADGAALFVDTMGATLHRAGDGYAWTINDGEHRTIPGALWLPTLGLGKVPETLEPLYRARLEAEARAVPGRPLLFFCKADCWLSWNAARRATEWGLGPVLWLADGVDGWAEAGLPLEKGRPAILPDGENAGN